jgi:hypothetical protein
MRRHHTLALLRAALVLLLLCGGGCALAADQDPERIRAAAEAAVRARTVGMGQVFVRADALDPRLRLPECPAPLVVGLSGDAALRAQVRSTAGLLDHEIDARLRNLSPEAQANALDVLVYLPDEMLTSRTAGPAPVSLAASAISPSRTPD